MRRAWCLLVLCAAVAVGCFNTRADVPSGPSVVRSFAPYTPVEGIVLESVLFERPIGDSFLDRDLWKATLPVGSQETRVLLDENGLRAAVLAGNPPQQFQTLLESETEAINARQLTFAQRNEEVLPTSGPHAKCEFHLLADLAGKRTPVSLEKANCGVWVRPEATNDDRVKITCEPQIQYGQRRELIRPTSDGTGFTKYEEVPLARYPALTFDVPLGRNEFLLIGWHAEQGDTIGAALFGVEANSQPRQRVLVIRARQVNPTTSSDLPPIGHNRRPSIAAEAGRPSR
jgi:hypothetical protein